MTKMKLANPKTPESKFLQNFHYFWCKAKFSFSALDVQYLYLHSDVPKAIMKIDISNPLKLLNFQFL